ncbi:hypothetical protein [Streptomyces sp. NPDC001657]|uniref:hypothetical protein n=1 Tax=Streptomyces sp. NPDC001657 TaxID=3154522 RepID=UPI00331D8AF4
MLDLGGEGLHGDDRAECLALDDLVPLPGVRDHREPVEVSRDEPLDSYLDNSS